MRGNRLCNPVLVDWTLQEWIKVNEGLKLPKERFRFCEESEKIIQIVGRTCTHGSIQFNGCVVNLRIGAHKTFCVLTYPYRRNQNRIIFSFLFFVSFGTWLWPNLSNRVAVCVCASHAHCDGRSAKAIRNKLLLRNAIFRFVDLHFNTNAPHQFATRAHTHICPCMRNARRDFH